MKRIVYLTALVTACCAAVAAGAAVVAGGATTPTRTGHGGTTRPPASQFTARVDNQWFPLAPGTRYVYTGVKDGKSSRDVVNVTHKTKTIDGVSCTVVEDRLYLRGHLEERTTDWYAQDSHGNVWYFGEDTAELDTHGRVTSRAGSFVSGVNGARAGIYIPGRPHVGQSGQQEYAKGQAEDRFKILSLFGTVAAPGTKNALLVQETTPLEPGTVDHKLYVRGVGTVFEQAERGGNERNELISVTRGG